MVSMTMMGNSNELMEMKWGPVVLFSFLFHLAVFSAVLFVPGSFPTIRAVGGVVYEVNLVEMPGGGSSQRLTALTTPREGKTEALLKRETKARRIEEAKSEQKPLVVAKKTVEKTVTPTEKPKESPSELIAKAVEKIEKKVKSDNTEHLEKAISGLQAKVSGGTGTGPGAGPSAGQGGLGGTGGPMALYQMEVEARIKSNWSYPVAMDRPKNLEAVVVLMVRQDGTIVRSRIEKRSSSALFDESVLKAIERSNPLPPFPESYRKSSDEIEITFNLKDLEGR